MNRQYDPQRHHRHSIRLRGYDYTWPGAYFVTICTHQRENLFADPRFLRIAERAWRAIPDHPHAGRVSLDAWVVMPNHVHGLLILQSCDGQPGPSEAPIGAPAGSLGAIVGNYKSVVARRINDLRRTPGAPVWQRNYYERVVRDDRQLVAFRRYITENPARWAADAEDLEEFLAGMPPPR